MASTLSDAHKVAAVLLAIDQGLAAGVLRFMGEDQVELVTRAMKELEEMAVDETTLEEIFREMMNRMRHGGIALGDVGGVIKTVLLKAFGDTKGNELIDSVEKHTLASKPFAVFEQVPPEELASLLSEEHPQITSVFLAHVDTDKAGKIIACFPDDKRADIIHRIATLGRSSPEIVQKVVEVMRSKVKELGLSTSRSEPKAWVKKAAQILNRLSGEKGVLDEIGGRNQEIADQIREEMFTFDDLEKLDKKSMQKLLGSVDTAVLAMALKACSPGAEENIFENLSKRAKEMVIDERDAKGPVPLSEVLESQKELLDTVRTLMDSGEIIVAGGTEEMV